MIELNKALKTMGEKTDKSWTYLKGLFNSAMSEYAGKFGDALDDDTIMRMSLVKVGKKYDLTKEDVEGMIEVIPDMSDDDKQLAEDIESMFEEDEETHTVGDAIDFVKNNLVVTDDPNHGEPNLNATPWDRFLTSIPDPTKPKTDYEKTPSLIIEIGATYYLEMTNLEAPYSHEFEGQYGAYMKHAFKVTLVKISDEDLYGEVYKFGDMKGKPAYKDGKNYTLWLDDKAAGFYKIFWANLTDDGLPDKRVFTYKFSKKGKYNIYNFGLPKKR